MGLDITAYGNLTKVENPELDDDGYAVTPRQVRLWCQWSEDHWPGRAEGIERGTVYEYEDAVGFRAGSYGWYSSWRDWLARVAGYESAKAVWDNPPPEGPFVELINFADNEGLIGPVVSAKLAKDFQQFRDAAEKTDTDTADGKWFFEQYCKWQQAFELAADNGAVDFH